MLFAISGDLTEESLRAFIENPSDRRGPAEAHIEACGGKLHHMWQFTRGATLLIVDAPDTTVITAIQVSLRAINRLSNVKAERLLTTTEFQAGVKQAQKGVEARR